MKRLNWVIAFLLLAILLAGCQDEYGYSTQTDPDVVMAQNLLSESQQLGRERAAIAAEDAQLSADAIAFTQGPERDFLSTLNEQEALAYKKLLSAYVSAANEAEIDASLREVFRALPKEKAFRFFDVANGIAGLGERLTILIEKTDQYNEKNQDFQRRHAAAGRYLVAESQQQQRRFDYFQQQQKDQRLREQEREQELYRRNMLNTMTSIQSDLDQMEQQQRQEELRQSFKRFYP